MASAQGSVHPDPFIVRGPIQINGNSKFTSENGVSSGSGSTSDPYVIEGWEIEAPANHGIDIRDTTASFVIREVRIHSGGLAPFNEGISFRNVTDGQIRRAELTDGWAGVAIRESRNITIADTDIEDISFGVLLEESSDIAVQNTTIRDGIRGFDIFLVDGLHISGSNVFRMNFWGVYATGLRRLVFEGNNISDGTHGLNVYLLLDSMIQNNTLSEGAPGLIAELAENVTIENNQLHWLGLDVSEDVFVVQNNLSVVALSTARDILVDSNRFESNRDFSFYAKESTNLTLINNTFLEGGVLLEGTEASHFVTHTITPDNSVNGAPLLHHRDCSDLVISGVPVGQLLLVACERVAVSNISIRDTEIGLLAAYVGDLTIQNSNFSANRVAGVRFLSVSNLSFSNNRLQDNRLSSLIVDLGTGVRVEHNNISDGGPVIIARGQNLTFRNNTLVRLGAGLRLDQWSDAEITRNELDDNWDGIKLTSVTGAAITENNLLANRIGIFALGSANVSIYHNRIVDSRYPAADDRSTGVRWDNGYPSGGNFWSGYEGYDDCSGPNQDNCTGPDGLGDIPYPIDEDSQDGYPLVELWIPNILPVARPLIRGTAAVGESLSFDGSQSYDPDGSVVTHSWEFGDGTSAEGVQNSHAYTQTGNYAVTLTVVDNRHGVASETLSVQIFPVLSLELSANVTQGVAPLTVSFTARVTGGTPPYAFYWLFGDGTRSFEKNPTHTFTEAGHWLVNLRATDGIVQKVSRTLRILVDSPATLPPEEPPPPTLPPEEPPPPPPQQTPPILPVTLLVAGVAGGALAVALFLRRSLRLVR